jgi:hypothetical protein
MPLQQTPDLTACTPLADIQSAYSAWVAAFGYSDGCNASDNIADVPTLPANVACAGADLMFTYIVTDDCSTVSLTATFTVAPADPIVLDATPTDPNLTACTPLADIQAAYSAWVAAFGYSDGCNATDNIADVPELPENVACAGADLMFTYIVTDDCGTKSLTATFTVAPADPNVLDATPTDPNLTACTPLADIQSAYSAWVAAFGYSDGCNASDNIADVPELPENVACAGADLMFTYIVTDDCGTKSLTATFTVAPADPIVLDATPTDPNLTACTPLADIQSAYSAWVAAFGYSDGCNATDNIADVPELPENVACAGADLMFTYIVTDDCGTKSLTATFTVAPADPNVLDATPTDPNLTACTPLADIQSAYSAWVAAFGYSDGCNASDNIADVPELPENVACAGADLMFTYIVTDDCGTKSLTATFTVAPAEPIVLDATPTDPNLTACTPLADIQSAYSAWVAAFGYSDGCNTSDNIADVPELPENVACAGADLMFTYIVTDDCGTKSLTATFTVAPAEPIVLDATPTDPNLTACTPLTDINTAYTAWVDGFGFSDGCNASDNIADVPTLPANVACAGADLIFTYIVTDDCGTKSLTATFTVAPAEPIVLDATPTDPNLTACTPLADIQSAYSAWVAAFGYSDGCNASDNIADVPTLPANVACAGADLMFTYIVTDDCGTKSLTATFTVAPAEPIVLDAAPTDPNLTACTPLTDIQTAYTAWVAAFGYSDGCNASDNIADVPQLCPPM